MKIKATVLEKKTIYFRCEDCHMSYVGHHLVSYFWNSELPKDDLEKALVEFTTCLNTKKVSHLFPKKKTGIKLLRILCHCDPQVIDLEYHKGVRRAKKILELGLQQLKQEKQ